jgi:hypothetical protein
MTPEVCPLPLSDSTMDASGRGSMPGARDVQSYYPKQDVAVEVPLA